MAQEYTLNTNEIPNIATTNLIKRVLVMAYGLVGAVIGLSALLWLILAIPGLVPYAFSPLQTSSTVSAIVVNLSLIIIFALQHSIMARPRFKSFFQRWLPHAIERSTFSLTTGLLIMFILTFWQTLPGIVWQAETIGLKITLWIIFAIGWSWVVMSILATNIFEFLGIRQCYLYFKNKPYTATPFTKKYMYSFSRHPIMLGLLVGLWSVPSMSVSLFVLSSLLSILNPLAP